MRNANLFNTPQGMAIVGILILSSACSGGSKSVAGAGTTAPATPVVSVTIVGVPSDVTSGSTLPVSAQVAGSSNTAVTWTVDDIPNGNADVGTIAVSGNAVTYSAPATEGSHVMAAVSVTDPTKTARARFTVHHPSSISSVLLSPAALVSNVNAQNQFTVTVLGTGNYNSEVTWSAQLGSITSTGLYTAPTAGNGDVVTATCVQDPSKTATASVTVTVPTNPPSISSLVVSPATLALNATAQNQFSAAVTGTGSYSSSVTWSAQRGSISITGLYTAPSTAGADVVTAKSVQDASKTATASVTVSVPTNPPSISTLAVSPATLVLNVTALNQFTVTVTGTGSYSSSVSWSAQRGSISSTGLYSAPSTSGTDVVTAKSVQDTSKIATSSITVTIPSSPPSISSVAVSPATLTLNVNAQNQFAATVTGTGSYSSNVTWSALRGNISSAGLYTAPSAAGTDVVTAKSVQDTNKSATANITVTTSTVPAGTSVKAYGAKGDGVTDDSSAIQSCINAVAGTGGTVVVPDGTYMINVNLNGSFGLRLGSNMTFAMTSGAILKAISTSNSTYSVLTAGTVSNVTITGGTLMGERTTHSGSTGENGHCLVIGNAHSVTVNGVTVKEGWGDGILVTNTSTAIILTKVTADHNRRMGISATSVDGLEIGYCTVKNTGGLPGGGAGIDMEPNAGETTTHVNIHHNTIQNNLSYGIATGGRYDSGAITSAVTIDHNTVTGNSDHGIYSNDGTESSYITNNTVTSNGGNGISLGGNPYTTNMTVTGNTVSTNSGWGIWVESARNPVVTGNTGSGNSNGTVGHDGSAGTYAPNAF
jgi:parallel beta-helix repeat protein